ncbi:hypothetical protein [Allopontixanthobacter sp.]|uniref:hypothetical protein n=1 Tax=Allopontixanthobacter sp. TaxID=2906452 RepID=UPI002ABB6CA5|nr:hypothetical protein [Allopontixanthobacter sp.]MDZ4307129.1 hypothetical protein [Allopontixanthobacter sp.]
MFSTASAQPKWLKPANLGEIEAEKWRKSANPLAPSHYRHYSAPGSRQFFDDLTHDPEGACDITRCLRNFYMRKFVLAAAAAGAALTLVACSEAAPEAEADSAMADAEANMEAAGESVDAAAADVDAAADATADTAEATADAAAETAEEAVEAPAAE